MNGFPGKFSFDDFSWRRHDFSSGFCDTNKQEPGRPGGWLMTVLECLVSVDLHCNFTIFARILSNRSLL